MTEYNTLNVKLSNSQLNKLKNSTEVTLNLSSSGIGNSINKSSLTDKLLLFDKEVPRLCKAFANNKSANIKLSKT